MSPRKTKFSSNADGQFLIDIYDQQNGRWEKHISGRYSLNRYFAYFNSGRYSLFEYQVVAVLVVLLGL